MKHATPFGSTFACLIVAGLLLWPGMVGAQSLADYTTSPPFLNTTATPNVLLLFDNSGSMNSKAYDEPFDPTKVYYGAFNPYECYTYATNRFQPDPAANPTTLGTCGSSYPWNGNLLNYVSMRRVDIAKVVLTGGKCTSSTGGSGRDSVGNCLRTVGQDNFSNTACCKDQTQSVTVAQASGRMPAANIPVSGNVYFHLMGSISALKGSFCVDDDSTKPTGSSCSDADGFAESNSQIIVDHFEPTTGVIQQVGAKARFGLMEFNSNSGTVNGGKVMIDVGGNMITLLNAIDNTVSSEWTPLSESLYEATRYFAQIPPAYTTSDYSHTVQNRDPYYFTQPQWASTSQYVTCCKSFVIIFTDGQPTQDTNVPSTIYDYVHATGGHALIGVNGPGHCSTPAGCTVPHSNAIHSSHGGGLTNHGATSPQVDHHDNCSSYFGGLSSDSCNSNGSHYLDDVAYWAHTTDLRPCNGTADGTIAGINVTGKCLQGFQNLTVYTFFAFGTGAKILQDAAKYGGFEDLNGNNQFDAADVWDRVNNFTGAAGADGLPDTYFESANADDMKDKLVATINSILARSSSGTSASVLASSSTGEGALYQAYFYPRSTQDPNVTWIGFTHGLFVDSFGNLREDTVQDGRLIYDQDYILKTYYDSANGEVVVERYRDLDGDGKADPVIDTNGDTIPDTPQKFDTKKLNEVKGIWEAGRRLALMPSSSRKILTWVDPNGDGIVDGGTDNGTHTNVASGEVIPFTTANSSALAPYLRGEAAPSPYQTDAIIEFIRGCEPSACSAATNNQTPLRQRILSVVDDAGANVMKVWKYGDPIHSTPTIVAAPRERYDVLYGDASYTAFLNQYRSRRQVAYVGANDGILHAFNVGFYNRGDDTSGGSPGVEHGWFSNTATLDGRGQKLGDELWGFIPMQLLPHLKWLAQTDYSHVYYVDLKPKVTDARIFTPDTDHPNGWGTILIGGFRLGGSCEACPIGNGPAMSVTANFTGAGNTTRKFYSAYFVLDITNPEVEPKLLWSFTDTGLGFATGYPTIVRVNPSASAKTDNTNAKWFVIFGSGPTGYDGSIVQSSRMYAVNLKTGPTTGNVVTINVDTANASYKAFMGDLISLDKDLDYRADAIYGGSVVPDGSLPWRGKLYRLTTGIASASPPGFGANTNPSTWGFTNEPTKIIESFTLGGSSVDVGPIVAAPTVTLDDAGNVWLFFGTGRYFGANDKTDATTQYFFGIKDSVLSGSCAETSATNCIDNDLVNVSNATVCVSCASTSNVTGVSGATSFATLMGLVQSKEGWVTTMPTARERVIVAPTLLGGVVFFPSFVPVDDICSGVGQGYLYGLFYLTGSAYTEPVLGTSASGADTISNRNVYLGEGMASQAAIHIGGQGSGGSGTSSGTGCQGRTTLLIQTSTGSLNGLCSRPPKQVWSRYLSWNHQRD